MSAVLTLDAHPRTTTGTGPARTVRNKAEIPGVLYGPGFTPLHLAVNKKIFDREIQDPNYATKLYDIQLDGKHYKAIIRAVQYHPVTDQALHIDFFHVSKGSKLHLSVPIQFINEDKCPGIKRGGVLNIVAHELELTVDPEHIPESLIIDLEGMNIGSTVHLKDIILPQGASATHADPETTLATLVSPSSDKADEPAEPTS